MSDVERVVVHSINGYSEKFSSLLLSLIDENIFLFCVQGKDCELWHDYHG